ncbi:hypothetical protein MABM_25810 [Mycobacteroides abscessus]|nr:hypothetical protein MABM_25810 [Mycobacteroides abscessus]
MRAALSWRDRYRGMRFVPLDVVEPNYVDLPRARVSPHCRQLHGDECQHVRGERAKPFDELLRSLGRRTWRSIARCYSSTASAQSRWGRTMKVPDQWSELYAETGEAVVRRPRWRNAHSVNELREDMRARPRRLV